MARKHLAGILPLAFLAGCDMEDWGDSNRFKDETTQTYPLKPGGRLSVESFNGSIEIVGWERDQVEVHTTKYASRQELLREITIDGAAREGMVQIKANRPDGGSRRGNMGAAFRIRAPRRLILERVATSNGPVRVEMIEGDARIHTSNGPVTLSQHRGDVDVETSNGPVELKEFRGAAAVATSNGPVNIRGAHGYVQAKTSNGPIHAELEDLTDTRPVRLTTSNGPITLRLPGGANARVKASTSNSGISCEFPLTAEASHGKTRLEGTIGSGGPFVVLDTSNGPIRISRN